MRDASRGRVSFHKESRERYEDQQAQQGNGRKYSCGKPRYESSSIAARQIRARRTEDRMRDEPHQIRHQRWAFVKLTASKIPIYSLRHHEPDHRRRQRHQARQPKLF